MSDRNLLRQTSTFRPDGRELFTFRGHAGKFEVPGKIPEVDNYM